MSRPTPGTNNQELDTINSSQIYTLAHAVRSNKKSLEKKQFPVKKHELPIKQEISMQIKRELKKNLKTIVPRQPRSHLPMKMIVSKMATRKRPNDENEDPASKLDLSTYRQYQLEPPPWRNSLHSTRRQRPSEFDKLLSSMKEKYAELDTSSQRSCPMRLKGQPDLKQKKLECLLSDSNLSGRDVLNTPRLDFNYNQLYRGTNTAKENHKTSVVLDEDPLGVDSSDHQTTEVDQFRDTSSPTDATMPNNKPEFVWNPVVLYDSSKFQLFPKEEAEIEHQLSPSQHLPRNYCQELPSCFDSPTWESSSTCSEHTVAEERLQLTIFANRGDMSMLGRDYLRRSHSPTNPWN